MSYLTFLLILLFLKDLLCQDGSLIIETVSTCWYLTELEWNQIDKTAIYCVYTRTWQVDETGGWRRYGAHGRTASFGPWQWDLIGSALAGQRDVIDRPHQSFWHVLLREEAESANLDPIRCHLEESRFLLKESRGSSHEADVPRWRHKTRSWLQVRSI